MQIDIDFDVYKALTALRVSEIDSYNAVIRRLLDFPVENAFTTLGSMHGMTQPIAENALAQGLTKTKKAGLFGANKNRNALATDRGVGGLLAKYLGGVWFSNVHFPDGTKFRSTYKGRTYFAEIKGDQWVGSDGVARSSPSEAASAISSTNVNGWRFWYFQMPGDPGWRRLDELKA
jgi:hypothetical protein